MVQPLQLLQPHRGHPPVVAAYSGLRVIARVTVRSFLLINMAHSRAGDDLQPSSTHPDPEGHLDVLPSPDLHALVVPAELLKPAPVHSKEAASHCRRPD